MKYTEYLSSAKRHNHACKVLKTTIDGLELGCQEYKYLLINLYYLSGYVIECALKYKIYEVCGYSLTAGVDDLVECDKVGIEYKKRVKTHDFTKLQEYLSSKLSDFTFQSENVLIDCLLSNWSIDLRYENVELDYDLLKELHNHTTIFLRKI